MLNGFRVSDTDMHIVEPVDLWQRYMDPAFSDRLETRVSDRPGLYRDDGTSVTVKGAGTGKSRGSNQYSAIALERGRDNVRRWYGEMYDMGWTAEAQLRGMDQQSIDLAFLYPTSGLYVLANDGIASDVALAVARAYNDWLGDFTSADRGRLAHVAMVPLQDPQGAIGEARRCASAYGSKGVFVRGEPHDGRILDDPVYEGLWTELEALDMAVGLHHSTHAMVPTLGSHRFNTRLQSHTASHPMEQMSNVLALIGGGVLERHPKLRFAFLESGAGWVPYHLWRFDQQYKELGFESPEMTMKPSDYFRRQCWVAVEPTEPHMDVIVDFLGEDRTVISSDFPHVDHPPGELTDFAERADIPEGIKRKTLWDNTMALYGE